MWYVMYVLSLVGLVVGAGLIVLDFMYIRFGFSFGMFAVGAIIAIVSAYVNVKLTD